MPSSPSAIHCETIIPTLKTPDVAAATVYYRDKLGFTIEFLWGDPPGHAGVRLGARCKPENIASRRTLEKAGMLPCGRILAGKVKP
jgi:catechol 2,3-dioxygenase-like lactoylglutathione lyase family enzyme